MTSAVIFAGAGASKAVASDRYPTTREFFDRLPSTIKDDPVFKLVDNFLRRHDSSRVIDIEEVLWELQTLLNFINRFQDNEDFMNYTMRGHRLLNAIGEKTWSFGNLPDAMYQSQRTISRIVETINEQVYEFYATEPSKAEVADNWMYLLSKVKKEGWRSDIFTTNYDLVIETAALMDGSLDFESFAGHRGLAKKRLDLNRWMTADDETRLLTKLHGSVDWQYIGEEIYVGSPVYTGNHKKHAIIYPGFKGDNGEEFFNVMHAYLGRRLEEAEICVFIGFAFRDEYVNRLLADRVNPRCKFFVINPEKNIRLPSPARDWTKITAGFDRKSIDKIFLV